MKPGSMFNKTKSSSIKEQNAKWGPNLFDLKVSWREWSLKMLFSKQTALDHISERVNESYQL